MQLDTVQLAAALNQLAAAARNLAHITASQPLTDDDCNEIISAILTQALKEQQRAEAEAQQQRQQQQLTWTAWLAAAAAGDPVAQATEAQQQLQLQPAPSCAMPAAGPPSTAPLVAASAPAPQHEPPRPLARQLAAAQAAPAQALLPMQRLHSSGGSPEAAQPAHQLPGMQQQQLLRGDSPNSWAPAAGAGAAAPAAAAAVADELGAAAGELGEHARRGWPSCRPHPVTLTTRHPPCPPLPTPAHPANPPPGAGEQPARLRLLLLGLLRARLQDPALAPAARAAVPVQEADALLASMYRQRFQGSVLHPEAAGYADVRSMAEAACGDVVAVRYVKVAERRISSAYVALPAFCDDPKAAVEAAWRGAIRHGPAPRAPFETWRNLVGDPGSVGSVAATPMQLVARTKQLLRRRMLEVLHGKLGSYALARLPADYEAAWGVPLEVALAGAQDLATFVGRVGLGVAELQAGGEDGQGALLVPAEALRQEAATP
jgi:hypothetical protein